MGVIVSLLVQSPDDCGYVRDFIDADCLGEEEFLLKFLNGSHPQVLRFFLAIILILGQYNIIYYNIILYITV